MTDTHLQGDEGGGGEEASGLWPGLGKAAAGALIFEVPALLTAEMWELVHMAKPWRLAMLIGLSSLLLLGLTSAVGFRTTTRLRDDVADAGTTIVVATAIAALFLLCFGVVDLNTPPGDLATMLLAPAILGSIGGALARAQFGSEDAQRQAKQRHGLWTGELLFMIVGALVFMVPVAPTDEIVELAWKMGPIRLIVLVLTTLVTMHAIVYTLNLREREGRERDRGFWELFSCYTVVGYATVTLVAAYLLWTLGRLDGLSLQTAIGPVVVLSLPGGLGAAVARLVL